MDHTENGVVEITLRRFVFVAHFLPGQVYGRVIPFSQQARKLSTVSYLLSATAVGAVSPVVALCGSNGRYDQDFKQFFKERRVR